MTLHFYLICMICNMPTEAIKNPYFHLMSVIETSVNRYNKNIGKLLPYI